MDEAFLSRHQFSGHEPGALDQDEAYFFLRDGQSEQRLRFHDYDQIYRRPGLYEQLFYERLRCTSPRKARDVLLKVLHENHEEIHSLRVLDLGAGNGMVGELLDAARASAWTSPKTRATPACATARMPTTPTTWPTWRTWTATPPPR